MGAVKSLWTILWTIALAAGFAGIGVIGVGLMVAAVWYPTGVFWAVIVFLVGLLGVFLALGTVMVVQNRPHTQPAR